MVFDVLLPRPCALYLTMREECAKSRCMKRPLVLWKSCRSVNPWALLTKYIRFSLVGGTGVAVDMALLWLLASPVVFRWNLTISKVVAAEIAILNNFLWNEVWTFKGLGDRQSWKPRLVRFGKYNLICATGVFASVLLLDFQVYWLEVNVYVANLTAIILVSIWNFLMNLKFGWNARTRARKVAAARPV